MALVAARRPVKNVPGEFVVDASCTNCDACRQIAPRTFREDGAARLGIEQASTGTDAVRLDADLHVIQTPGHTQGHQVLLFRDRVLLAGDHLASTRRRLAYRFEWVLPGHGRAGHVAADQMRARLQGCVAWMTAG